MATTKKPPSSHWQTPNRLDDLPDWRIDFEPTVAMSRSQKERDHQCWTEELGHWSDSDWRRYWDEKDGELDAETELDFTHD